MRIVKDLSTNLILTSIDIAGELIRDNVSEDQAGIPLYMDIQLIDTNTCQPLPHIYTDIWHCNATVSEISKAELAVLLDQFLLIPLEGCLLWCCR